MKRFLIICCILLTFSSCSTPPKCSPGEQAPSCLHILFIGNSYTYVNDLPKAFAALAQAGGHKVETAMQAQGGWTLADHLNSTETLDKIKSTKWDFVVLQEQSQIPSIEQGRTGGMYPAATTLVQKIRDVGAKPIFFMTWAHRDGWPENGMPSYASMQLQIDQGYLGIAQRLQAPVAPVGYAWFTAISQNPQLELWQGDGSHPSEAGTYLAACVFYTAIFRQSPEGLAFPPHLSQANAQLLQKIAAKTVLSNPQQWNLQP